MVLLVDADGNAADAMLMLVPSVYGSLPSMKGWTISMNCVSLTGHILVMLSLVSCVTFNPLMSFVKESKSLMYFWEEEEEEDNMEEIED